MQVQRHEPTNASATTRGAMQHPRDEALGCSLLAVPVGPAFPCHSGRRANRASVPTREAVVPCLGRRGEHACQPGTAHVLYVSGRAVPCLARVSLAGPCRAGPAHLARYNHNWGITCRLVPRLLIFACQYQDCARPLQIRLNLCFIRIDARSDSSGPPVRCHGGQSARARALTRTSRSLTPIGSHRFVPHPTIPLEP
jgi:hypothetical protein